MRSFADFLQTCSGRLCLAAVLCALLFQAWTASAEVRLPAIFGDHMVLQQERSNAVWGWAEPGEEVTVAFAGAEATAKADGHGKWMAHLDVPAADGQGRDLVVRGGNTLTLTNVVAGEVWLCSGQSNMKAGLASTVTGKEAVAAADLPGLRLFQVRMWAAPSPMEDLEGRWAASGPRNAGSFSAVAFFFGRELHRALGVPVGLIDSSSGGTAAEAWVGRSTLEADPVLKTLVADDPAFFQTVDQYEKDWADYQEAKAERRKPMPPYPKTPFRGWGYPASSFYNAMIAPLIPFSLRGVAWYQGEAKTGRPLQYERELTALIRDWRERWALGDFPFLVVQLPNIKPTWNWPITREAQLRVSRTLPNVGLAVTIDIGDPNDLHPRNKEPIGRRLALAAQAMAYGTDIVYSGPMLSEAVVDGKSMRLRFDHVGTGLVSSGGGPLKGFAIAGEDRTFMPAEAAVEDDTVVVRSADVVRPVAVRYAWEDNPYATLANREGLPASPFRTDTW